jgi:hypothetical protein
VETPLYRALVAEARTGELIDLGPVPLDGVDQKMPGGTRETRQQLRLLIKALADSYLARYDREYVNDVRRVPWASSQARASRAVNRFLEISEWAASEYGEEAAAAWASAGRIAEILVEDYSGWPSERYDDVASTFCDALRIFWHEETFLDLLAALKTEEA